MTLAISLEKALVLRDKGALLVDARSPAEFAEATIPGAINVPLLDNAERKEVGTLFKQEGKLAARRLGVRLVSGKIPDLVEQVFAARPPCSPPVVVFCWRGGMRSRALAQFLDLAGLPARQLEGGHKAFRRHVLQYFAQAPWGRLIVLRGLTGVGKTVLLHRLREDGYPVIDLEGLANHRGSAFGNLGLPSQPSQKMFEALLWDELRHIAADGYAITEGESRHIGRLVQPPKFFDALQQEISVWIEAPLDVRVRNILDDYPTSDELKQSFLGPLHALKERLGKEVIHELVGLLENSRWEELVRELMVRYYDPLYRHTLPVRRIEVEIPDPAGDLRGVRTAVRRILENS
jgi:tRNA 2-selenouridine synthase